MTLNIYAIGQKGRLECEALLCMATLQMFNTRTDVELFVCTPKNGPNWNSVPDMSDTPAARHLQELGVKVVTFENELFGSRYPHSNKMYALSSLPQSQPFIFFDSDHVFTGDLAQVSFDPARPVTRQTSMAWPVKTHERYNRKELWDAVYRKFGLATEGWFRDQFPASDPRHFPYFNGGVFYGRSAGEFFKLYRRFMHEMDQNAPEEIDRWSLYPFLDQVCLPLVMHEIGGSPEYVDKEYPFNRIGNHYFEVPYLFFPPGNKALQVAKEVIFSRQYEAVFRADPVFSFYFFEDGWEKVNDLAKLLAEKGYFTPGRWLAPADIKKILLNENLWRK